MLLCDAGDAGDADDDDDDDDDGDDDDADVGHDAEFWWWWRPSTWLRAKRPAVSWLMVAASEATLASNLCSCWTWGFLQIPYPEDRLGWRIMRDHFMICEYVDIVNLKNRPNSTLLLF